MSEVLSNDQIEALVAAAREGRAEEPQQHKRVRRVRAIDFSRPTKFAQDQQRRLQRAHETFCRTAGTRLSAELRVPIELEVLSIDQLTFAAAVAGIPQPSVLGIVEVTPLGTSILATAELSAVARMIERLLGGEGKQVRHRELSEVELTLARRLFNMVLEQLSLAWEELLGVQLSLRDLETKAPTVQLAPASEPTLAITIEARTEISSSTLSIVVPFRAIEKVADRLSAGHYSLDGIEPGAPGAVRSALQGVEVEVRAEVAAKELTIDEVLQLQPGSVIKFGIPATAGVTLFAGQVPIHRASPGRDGTHRAIQVVHRLEQS
jgi:flagellar motor switch protein FliM